MTDITGLTLNQILGQVFDPTTGQVRTLGGGDQTLLDFLTGLFACADGTPFGVDGSASSGLLLAANSSRKGVSGVNKSTATLYILTSTTATGAAISKGGYNTEIGPGGYYELPFGYTGKIWSIWSAANGYFTGVEFI